VTAYTGWPYGSDPFYVVVEPGTASEEKILVTRTGSTDTTINVASDSERGQDGTSAVSHSTGSTVFPVFTAVDADEANAVASVITADTTNGRIGIGTATPETPLSIVTTNKLGSTFTGTTAGEGLRVDQSDYSSGNYVSLIEGSNDDGASAPHVRIGAMYDGGGSQLSFGTSNSYGSGITNEALSITSEGRVGIGTATPDKKLHVEDATDAAITLNDSGGTVGAATNSKILFEAGGSTAGEIGFVGTTSGIMSLKNQDGRLDVAVVSNDPILFKTNDTERMRVDDNGRIGINDTTPSYTLDVNGDINATGDLRIGGTAIGAWTAWTPTIVGCTASSGTSGFYTKVNDLVIGWGQISEPTSFTTTVTVDVPVLGYATYPLAVGTRIFGFDGSSPYLLGSRPTTSQTIRVTQNATNGSSIGTTAPFTWGAGDYIFYTFMYQAA
jgi:hypothetical protein